MNRRQAIAKATVDTTGASAGLLDPEQSSAFLRTIKEKTALGQAMRLEIRKASSGEINKLSTASRIIRAATENSDDGYRAGASFPTVDYSTNKIRLPWEVTEDVFHENIEGEALEAALTSEMTAQFALDLEDLDVNGDASSGDPFLGINNGILKLLSTNASGDVHRIDGSTIDSGAISKAHFFAGIAEMPNKYVNQGNLKWMMSPAKQYQWIEWLTDRETGAGDAALSGTGKSPLGIDILPVPSFPDERIVLANPRNFVRVVSWEVRKRKVTGETDAELAATDKRFYVFHIKEDVIVEEDDAVVDIHTMDP